MPEPADHIAQFFDFDVLPPHLRDCNARFSELAHWIIREVPRNPERTVALRKLLEGKDAAVRAVIATRATAAPPAEPRKDG